MDAASTPPGHAVTRVAGVREANDLTLRWLRAVGEPVPVLSGAGAWPLMAALAAGAAGKAREELAEATGIEPAEAMDAVGGYARALSASAALRFSTGFWASPLVTLDPTWTDRLPDAWSGSLSGDLAADKRTLDTWAEERTLGLIGEMPVELTPETMLVLATALAVRTDWAEPFKDAPLMPQEGPWRTDRPWLGLNRTSSDLSALRSAEGVTLLTVAGREDVDVHLALGEPDAGPAEVLATAVRAADGRTGALPAESGPGVTVSIERSHEADPAPLLRVTTVGFAVNAAHDLLRHAEVFGLATAATRGDHFPGVSADRLEISDAAQSAMAVFSAKGFEAAAVTAVGMRMAGAFLPPDNGERKVVSAAFTRPFGYVAVHRPTGLALVAGWVGEPKRFG
ncbi:serpin family protein [Phytomonospora sp. NPDC050363]|uniref:serpin family protein n=1 Tax=Phytomonospora sp. NPDC050363 TaxID=3155642 RepID=UPI003403114C